LFVGSVAIGIGVGLLTANPLLGAMAAGAASNLFDYGARGLLNDEKLSWSGAFQSATLGALAGAAFLGATKLAIWGAKLIGRAVSGTRRLIGLLPAWVSVPRTAMGASGDVLGEVDAVPLGKLRQGVDIPIPRGTTGIRTLMSDLTLVSENEVALLRMKDGTRILRMGGPKSVSVQGADRIIAHTHPSGWLKFSDADILALWKRGQNSSVIIDPRANMGVRLPVPYPKE
jgi:hypothetical protein